MSIGIRVCLRTKSAYRGVLLIQVHFTENKGGKLGLNEAEGVHLIWSPLNTDFAYYELAKFFLPEYLLCMD